jgi:hypothetical protein
VVLATVNGGAGAAVGTSMDRIVAGGYLDFYIQMRSEDGFDLNYVTGKEVLEFQTVPSRLLADGAEFTISESVEGSGSWRVRLPLTAAGTLTVYVVLDGVDLSNR